MLTWGNGQQGQLGRVGERLSDRVKAATLLLPARLPLRRGRSGGAGRGVDVAAGTYATFVLTGSGALLATGLNNYGQLGVDNEGAPLFAPAPVAGLAPAGLPVAVRPGQHHTLVLVREEGTGEGPPPRLYSFGRPTYGRLGRKDVDVAADSACPRPELVDGLEGQALAGAAAGLAVSGAFSADGDAWLWGFGTSNQLAKGDDDEGTCVALLPRVVLGFCWGPPRRRRRGPARGMDARLEHFRGWVHLFGVGPELQGVAQGLDEAESAPRRRLGRRPPANPCLICRRDPATEDGPDQETGKPKGGCPGVWRSARSLAVRDQARGCRGMTRAGQGRVVSPQTTLLTQTFDTAVL